MRRRCDGWLAGGRGLWRVRQNYVAGRATLPPVNIGIAVWGALGGAFREDRQAVLADLGEAALDREDLGLTLFAVIDRQRAVADRRHERRVMLEHAEVALGAGHDDHINVLRADQLFRRDEFEGSGVGSRSQPG
eukprot:gene1682-2272_t